MKRWRELGCQGTSYWLTQTNYQQTEKPLRFKEKNKRDIPQGHKDAILYHSFSFEYPAGKCQTEASESDGTVDRGKGELCRIKVYPAIECRYL